MTHILQVSKLGKQYGERWAVKDLNLTIYPGEIYGFLGRNGAGKTTTIRMIVGLIKPTTGDIELFGQPREQSGPAVFNRIAATIESPGFYPNLTARENLLYYAKVRNISEPAVNDNLDLFGLTDAADRIAKDFSLGMKQRLGLARAMLHKPELLILDEPTNGLDPAGIKEIREMLRRINAEKNVTIMLSSHILSEVEQVATRVGFIHKGTFVDEFTLKDFHMESEQYLQIKVSNADQARGILNEKLGITACQVVQEGTLKISDTRSDAGTINRILVESGIEVSHLSVFKETLEDRFMRLTGGMEDDS